jgi:hypothetical protein
LYNKYIGIHNIQFIYPALLVKLPKAGLFFQVKETSAGVEFSYTSGNNSKRRLVISGVTYADTGYYYCVRNGTTECHLQMESVQRKYVYVKG